MSVNICLLLRQPSSIIYYNEYLVGVMEHAVRECAWFILLVVVQVVVLQELRHLRGLWETAGTN